MQQRYLGVRFGRRWVKTTIAALGGSAVVAAGAFAGSGGISSEPDSSGGGDFPVKAPHTYGDGLGAGRGHHGRGVAGESDQPVGESWA